MRYFSSVIRCARNVTDTASRSPLPSGQKGWSPKQGSSAAVIPQRQTDSAEDTTDTGNSSSYQSSRSILWSLGYPTKTCEDSHFNEMTRGWLNLLNASPASTPSTRTTPDYCTSAQKQRVTGFGRVAAGTKGPSIKVSCVGGSGRHSHWHWGAGGDR